MIHPSEAGAGHAPETYLQRRFRITSQLVDREESRRDTEERIRSNHYADAGLRQSLIDQFTSAQDRLVDEARILGTLFKNPNADTLRTFIPGLSPEDSERFSALDLAQPAGDMPQSDRDFIDGLVKRSLSSPNPSS